MPAQLETDRPIPEQAQDDEAALDPLEDQEPALGGEINATDESTEEQHAERDEVSANLNSIQQYLHDIGSVPLLSREREIEIAMQMERGEKQIFAALFATPMALRHVLELGTAVARGETDLVKIIEKPDEADHHGSGPVDAKPFLGLIAKLRRLAQHRDEIRRQLARSRLSQRKRAALVRKDAAFTEKVINVIRDLRLASDEIGAMVQQLKRLNERLDAIDRSTKRRSSRTSDEV